MDTKWMSPNQIADKYPGLTKGRLSQMRFNGDGPPFYKPTPRTVLYKEHEVDEYVEGTVQTSTSAMAS